MLVFRDFPAPMQLLLLAARTRLSAAEVAQIEQLLVAPLDWPAFLSLAAHHRLSSVAFETLAPRSLPDVVRAELHRRATGNAFEALRASGELCRICARFAAAGFELAVLKGVPLSQLLYGSPNARHVGDLDLLTSADRLPEQMLLLAELGYQRSNPLGTLTPRRLASYVRFWKDFTFFNPATGFALDLHWRLFNHRLHPANGLLAGARFCSTPVFGQPVRTLSASDQLLYLAAHGALDAWTYLKGLADIAALLRVLSAEELEEALARAAMLGLLPQVSAAIHLASAWMASAPPTSNLLLSSADPMNRRLQRTTASLLLRQDFHPQRSFPSPARWLLHERALVPGARSLAELSLRFLYRPRLWSTVDLPDPLFHLYPLLGLVLPPRRHSSPE